MVICCINESWIGLVLALIGFEEVPISLLRKYVPPPLSHICFRVSAFEFADSQGLFQGTFFMRLRT